MRWFEIALKQAKPSVSTLAYQTVNIMLIVGYHSNCVFQGRLDNCCLPKVSGLQFPLAIANTGRDEQLSELYARRLPAPKVKLPLTRNAVC